MRGLLKTCLCAGLVMAATGTAWAADPVCEVLAVLGETHLGDGGRALAVGDKLEPGAEVRTGASGRLRLRFTDASTVVVSDNSVLTIEVYDPPSGPGRKARFLLQLGLIGQKVTPGGSWEVRTPTAVTAVRGTEFSVEVGSDLDTSVNVTTGQVSVEAVQGTRSLRPRSVVQLDAQQEGTQCSPSSGCTAVMTWKPDRLKRVADLLSGV